MARAAAYPRKADITRAVDAAKACGIDVAGLEVSPDGAIKIVEARALARPQDEFERLADRL
jgi:hypothetical protein